MTLYDSVAKDVGSKIIIKLSSAFWYLDTYHGLFQARECTVPELFRQFQGYNHWKSHWNSDSNMKYDDLEGLASDIC